MKSKTRRAQCVAIAKDVLVQLRSKRLRPKRGVYLNLEKSIYGDAQKEFKTANCTACAVGAFFVSAVRKFDNFSGDGSAFLRSQLIPTLRVHFNELEIRIIENEFESFRRPTSIAMLRMLCRCIIANDGVITTQSLTAFERKAKKPAKAAKKKAPKGK